MLSTINTSLPTALQTLSPSQYLYFLIFLFIFILYHLLSASWLFYVYLLLYGGPGIPSLVEPGAFGQDGGVFFFFYFLGGRLHAKLWSSGQLGKPLRLTFGGVLGFS